MPRWPLVNQGYCHTFGIQNSVDPRSYYILFHTCSYVFLFRKPGLVSDRSKVALGDDANGANLVAVKFILCNEWSLSKKIRCLTLIWGTKKYQGYAYLILSSNCVLA